jgi:hypothetical protein
MPNYLFPGNNFFDSANIVEATIIPRIRGKKFPLPVRKKKLFQKLKYYPFKLCKMVFQYVVLLNER